MREAATLGPLRRGRQGCGVWHFMVFGECSQRYPLDGTECIHWQYILGKGDWRKETGLGKVLFYLLTRECIRLPLISIGINRRKIERRFFPWGRAPGEITHGWF